MGKEIFISHAWGYDELGRDNHIRSKEIADMLLKKNYGVWFDDYDMYGNIDNAIMKGINNSKIVIICLTKKYCEKVNNAINNNFLNDNCYKEWNYCLFKQKIIIPIIMEPCMKNVYFQDGIIQMYLHNTLFVDCSKYIDENQIIKFLNINNIFPNKQLSFNEKIYLPLVLKPIERSFEIIGELSPKKLLSPSKSQVSKKRAKINNRILCNRKKIITFSRIRSLVKI